MGQGQPAGAEAVMPAAGFATFLAGGALFVLVAGLAVRRVWGRRWFSHRADADYREEGQ